jgi:FAD-NAD(P)-binding
MKTIPNKNRHDADVVLVGAGPHALTVAAYLRRADPGLRLVVADPDGWLHRWRRQFAALALDRLRSACVHHPDPDPYALLRHARDTGRDTELYGDPQCPGTELFDDFCAGLVRDLDLDRALVREPVRELRQRPGGGVTVRIGRSEVRARLAVLATNPVRSRVPRWARVRDERLAAPQVAHSDTVDLRRSPGRGERVLVVGGGLTAAQLAVHASRVGAHTTLLSRSPLRARTFDTTPEWLGRALPALHAEPDPRRRFATIAAARRGTVPPPMLDLLRELAARGRLELARGERLSVVPGPAPGVRADGRLWTVDRLWLGTGHDLDWRFEPLLASLARRHPVRSVRGLPVLDPALCWPGTDVHVVGGLAALGIGPAARNVTGARMAAERIRRVVTGAPGYCLYPDPGVPAVARLAASRRRRRGRITAM